MSVADIHGLCSGLCELAGVAPPPLVQDEHGVTAFTVELRNVATTIAFAPERGADALLVLVDFGPLPEGKAAEAMSQLLEANFALLDSRPAFYSRNPSNGNVVLQYVVTLAEASAVELYQRVVQGVEAARRWREQPSLPGSTTTGASAFADFA